ncbi:TPA: winged helix-turn-helix domain-containing protein, partial [Streptococcus pneumoniae]
EELYERIYPSESDAQFRSIAEYIYQIRSKLKPYSINPIKTQWGGGYSWNEN